MVYTGDYIQKAGRNQVMKSFIWLAKKFSLSHRQKGERGIQKGAESASLMLGKSLSFSGDCVQNADAGNLPTYRTYGCLNQNQDELMNYSMNSSVYSKSKGLILIRSSLSSK